MSASRQHMEDRFARALLDYVAACGAVRLAELEFHAATTSSDAARAAKRWRSAVLEQRSARKALCNVERNFDANGGRVAAVAAGLKAAFSKAPGRAARRKQHPLP